MEQYIKSLQTIKLEFPELTQAIKNAHEEEKPYYYTNEINMINKIVLGVTAKEFKAQNGIDNSVNSIRPYLTQQQIKGIEALQRFDIGLIEMIESYQERKQMLTDYYMKLNQRKLIA